MKKNLGLIGKLFSLYFALVAAASAAPAALPLEHSLDLSDYEGRTFLDAMLARRDGIKAQLDDDYVSEYQFADWEQVEAALENFDDKIQRRVLGAFGNSRSQLRAFVNEMAGTRFRPGNLVTVIRNSYEGSGNIYALEHFFAIASGAGTLVRIDDENYYYNYGYKSGAGADDVRSGRSYGATLKHAANDASDVMYLNELEDVLTRDRRGVRNFYETMMEFLTRSDVSGYSEGMSPVAQAAMTDFIAIYTAELDRHIMVDLRPSQHPWENDLAEATMLAIFSAESGKLLKDGILVDAPLKDFWAMSDTGSGRSGIGIGRGDRRRLQKVVSDFERRRHPELVEAIEELIGSSGPNGDIFRGLMEYLNQKRTQGDVRANAEALSEAVVEFLMQVREDADEITAFAS